MMGLVRKHGRSGRKRGASRRERGYTLIEVMMAIGVLTAGAVGIMSLQSASTRGNMEARQMSTGAVLAQRWVERLRRDGLNWTQSNNTVSALLLARTTWLRTTPDPGAPVGWMVPADVPATGETANFDFYGNDTADGAEMRYCTNIRLEWLYPGRALRADVRVWWTRVSYGGSNDPTRAQLARCAAGVDPNTLTGDFRTRAAYASTVIRYTPMPSN